MGEMDYRKKRYKEKLELAEERINDIEILLKEFDDKFSRLACYKAFQELVEAIFDVVAMLLKDQGKIVEDDYTNVEKIEKEGIITKEDAEILREANGLRNRIIHRYNKTDDAVAKQSIENLLPHLENILERLVEVWKRIS